jgi:uncharacterized protein (TIGR04255 family)
LRRTTNFSPLIRLGIRYINRIDVPIKQALMIDIDAYLVFRPEIPNFAKSPLTGFMVQATKPTDHLHWNVSVSSTMMSPPPLIDHFSLVLDIDVFRTEQIPGREPDLWATVDEARPIKNCIFESCITDEARKLFI